MSLKKHMIFAITVLASVFLIFAFADMVSVSTQGEDSRQEISFVEALMKQGGAEAYDQQGLEGFVSKEKWSSLRKGLQLLLGRRQIDSVYLGKDGYLLEEHTRREYPDTLLWEKLELAEYLTEKWNAKVMLVPTADYMLQDKLPLNAPRFDQQPLLEVAREVLGEHFIDVEETLREHREEAYYRTERGWTTFGAYYAYQIWAGSMGVGRYPYNLNIVQTASDNLSGSLQQKIGYGDVKERFVYVKETLKRPVTCRFDFGETGDSMYFPQWLETDTPYAYYLDGSHAFTELAFPRKTGRKLFVIKGSYANVFVPLLAQHYDRIYLLEPDVFGGDAEALMASCLMAGENGMFDHTQENIDVLILYDCIEFLERFTWE